MYFHDLVCSKVDHNFPNNVHLHPEGRPAATNCDSIPNYIVNNTMTKKWRYTIAVILDLYDCTIKTWHTKFQITRYRKFENLNMCICR
jgi:hypothetical protein